MWGLGACGLWGGGGEVQQVCFPIAKVSPSSYLAFFYFVNVKKTYCILIIWISYTIMYKMTITMIMTVMIGMVMIMIHCYRVQSSCSFLSVFGHFNLRVFFSSSTTVGFITSTALRKAACWGGGGGGEEWGGEEGEIRLPAFFSNFRWLCLLPRWHSRRKTPQCPRPGYLVIWKY